MRINISFFSIGMLLFNLLPAQNISLFNQLNGNLDYTAIGNTLNTSENNSSINCVINTASSASLNLSTSQTVEAAYLYWAGSGSGDFNVTLKVEDVAKKFPLLLEKNYKELSLNNELTKLNYEIASREYEDKKFVDIVEYYGLDVDYIV